MGYSLKCYILSFRFLCYCYYDIHLSYSPSPLCTLFIEIEVLIDPLMKLDDTEDPDDSSAEADAEDVWEDTGLEGITGADFSATGGSLLGR